jgi:hypothetical protein
LNDGNLAVNRSSSDNKGFLSQEIIKLIHEHEVALQTLASSGLMNLYKEKVKDLDNYGHKYHQVGGPSTESNRLTEGIAIANIGKEII